MNSSSLVRLFSAVCAAPSAPAAWDPSISRFVRAVDLPDLGLSVLAYDHAPDLVEISDQSGVVAQIFSGQLCYQADRPAWAPAA